ncbi:MAG: hypothetical protein HPY75_09750 [Actinobacteria bacterium]|nr:hypothetical protein [Actinomycetota bacterium]
MGERTVVGMRVVLIPRSPWAVLLQGLGIVALGVVLVAWPHASIEVVRIAFGVLALAFGAMQVLAAFSEKHEDRWWRIPLALLAGTAGVVALAWPDATERVILILLGLWFLFTGLTILAAGLMLPADMSSRWVVALAGAALFIFGVFLLVNPSDRSPREITTALVVLIGAFVIFEGMLMAFYSLLLRRALKALEALEESV